MADYLLDYDEATEKYDPVFGIEIHVELSTKTKMFCPAPVMSGGEPNTLTTPVSLGLPGALPVINKRAVEYAVKMGLALNCEISHYTTFARKNYYYPDLTKNYQTSQGESPIVHDGYVDVELSDEDFEAYRLSEEEAKAANHKFRINIERAHLEEDAGKSSHIGGSEGRIFGADHSLIDYNRAGVPLIEIVTRPIIGTGKFAPKVAAAYVRAIRDIARALGISEAKMEQGNIRADVNVSLSPKGSLDDVDNSTVGSSFSMEAVLNSPLGTRTETKNVNSFRSVEKAMEYEIRRQAAILDNGKKVFQETRHWHEASLSTSAGRPKSDSDDYRYFDEPNLMPLELTDEYVDSIRKEIPELPAQKRERLQKEYGFSDLEMRDVVNADALDLIESTVQAGTKPNNARKWWMGEISRIAKEARKPLNDMNVAPTDVAEIEKLIADGKINDKIARQVLDFVLKGEGAPAEIVEKHNLAMVNDDGMLEAVLDKVFAEQQDVVEKLKSGNMAPIGVLIGAVMKETHGKADAKSVREMIMKKVSQ